MAAAIYQRSFATASAWVPLSAVPLRATVAVIAAPANGGSSVSLRWKGGPAATWPPQAAVVLEDVDLSEFEVRGPSFRTLNVWAQCGGANPDHAALLGAP